MFYPTLSSRIWYFLGSKINIFDSHRKHQTPAAILALSRFCFMALRTGKVGGKGGNLGRWWEVGEGNVLVKWQNMLLPDGGFPKMVGFPPKSSFLIGFSIINHPLWGTPIFGNTNFLFANNYNNWCIFNPLLLGGIFFERDGLFSLRFGHLFPSPRRKNPPPKNKPTRTDQRWFSRHGQGEGGCECRGQGRSQLGTKVAWRSSPWPWFSG